MTDEQRQALVDQVVVYLTESNDTRHQSAASQHYIAGLMTGLCDAVGAAFGWHERVAVRAQAQAEYEWEKSL